MNRIMIVDDEQYMVDSLYTYLIDVLSDEIEIIKAYSAIEALSYLEKNNFDVVVTDIRMPGMDGLELLKRIKENWAHCQVIFLTGYDQFEYAYAALKYKGVKYMLKNESFNEIANTIKLSINDHDEIIYSYKENMGNVELDLNSQQGILILDMIHSENDMTFDNILASPIDMDKPFMFVTAIISMQNNSNDTDSFDGNLYSACLVMKSLLDDKFSILITKDIENRVLMLFQPHEFFDYSIAADYLSRMLETSQNICDWRININLSLIIDTGISNDIIGRYNRMKGMIDNITNSNEVMHSIHLYSFDKDNIKLQNQNIFSSTDFQRYRNLLESHSFEAVELLDEIIEKLKDESGDAIVIQLDVFYHFAVELLDFMCKTGLPEDITLFEIRQRLMNHTGFNSWEEAFLYLREATVKAVLIKPIDTPKNQMLNKVKEYIKLNVNKNLTLSEVARNFYYNSSYLSRIFKKEFGYSLFDYVNRVRLERVVELLLSTNRPVKDIAVQCGFGSINYLYQFFRKAHGLTPQEFRKKHVVS